MDGHWTAPCYHPNCLVNQSACWNACTPARWQRPQWLTAGRNVPIPVIARYAKSATSLRFFRGRTPAYCDPLRSTRGSKRAGYFYTIPVAPPHSQCQCSKREDRASADPPVGRSVADPRSKRIYRGTIEYQAPKLG